MSQNNFILTPNGSRNLNDINGISVYDFDFVEGGLVSCSEQFKKMCEYCSKNDRLINVPSGKFLLDKGYAIPTNIEINFQKGATFLISNCGVAGSDTVITSLKHFKKINGGDIQGSWEELRKPDISDITALEVKTDCSEMSLFTAENQQIFNGQVNDVVEKNIIVITNTETVVKEIKNQVDGYRINPTSNKFEIMVNGVWVEVGGGGGMIPTCIYSDELQFDMLEPKNFYVYENGLTLLSKYIPRHTGTIKMVVEIGDFAGGQFGILKNLNDFQSGNVHYVYLNELYKQCYIYNPFTRLSIHPNASLETLFKPLYNISTNAHYTHVLCIDVEYGKPIYFCLGSRSKKGVNFLSCKVYYTDNSEV